VVRKILSNWLGFYRNVLEPVYQRGCWRIAGNNGCHKVFHRRKCMSARFDLSALSRRRSAKFAFALLYLRGLVMKRLSSVALLIVVASALVLMIGSAKIRVMRSASGGGSHAASPQAQPQPMDVGLFVAQGMPVQFTEVVAKNEKGSADLAYTLINNSGGSIGGVDLALLDFNPRGKLMRIQSWSVQMDVEASERQSFSVSLRHRVTPGDRLVLCVEAVRGGAGAWQVDFNDLAQAIGASVAGANATYTEVKQRAEKVPESFGGAYCSDAFARAFRLAKSGDGKSLTSFTCDRNQRFSAFSFSEKNLVN
jgi:hypothetical protein